jgi:hypothetical protein
MRLRSLLRLALWVSPALIVVATAQTDWSPGVRLGLAAAVVAVLAALIITQSRPSYRRGGGRRGR